MPEKIEQNLRDDAQKIFRAACKAADPRLSIQRCVTLTKDHLTIVDKSYELDSISQIYVIGAGKASAVMAEAIEEILGDRIKGGVINTKYDHLSGVKRITLNECGHPVPDERGVHGAGIMMKLAGECDKRCLVICLLSGGGSALLPSPAEGLTLADKQNTTQVLLSVGAAIEEVNAIRKHLSLLKGGGLSRFFYPASIHVLILSDVIGDRLDTIASGPTAPDTTTFDDCLRIIQKYGIEDRLPSSVISRIKLGRDGKVNETAKPGDSFLETTVNSIIGNNRLALEAAMQEGENLDYRTLILSSRIQGEAREIGRVYAAIGKESRFSGYPFPPPFLLIGGGETTVTLHGSGKGGRNQEMALSAAIDLEGVKGVVFLSGGTDGTDGPTDAAGAVCDGSTVSLAEKLGLIPEDFLRNNDSYNFFEQTGGLIKTGPTGTNVMDIQLVCVASRRSN